MADTSRSAATGAAPVSDEKAAATAEEYEKATGQADKAEQTNDPVMDAITEAEAKAVEDAPELEEPAWINKDYEEREQVEYNDVSGDEKSDESQDNTEPKKTSAKAKS